MGNPFFLWNEYGSSPETLSTNIAPLVFLNAGWNYILHLPAEVISRLIILEFILAGLFSTYFLGHKIFKHFTAEPLYLELSCTIMTIFYLFNPYALQRIVHLYHWIAYNLLPLILLLGLYFWETKKWRFPVLIALLLSFISFSPHYLVYTIYALLLWAILEIIYHFLHPVRVHKSLQQKIKLVLKALSLFLIFGFCFLTFSAYWLIPYLKLAFIENAPAAPGYFLTKEYFEVSQEKAKVIIETLALSPDRPQSKILNIFFWVFISFLPLLLFLPLLKRWRNKYTIFFSILGITAAIFSTMPIWGLGLYLKTLFDIPYLNQFGWLLRENIRVNGLLAFSYSFLLAFFTLMALKKAYPFPFTKKKSLT